MKNSITYRLLGSLLILSLGIINALESTPDLVISFWSRKNVYDYNYFKGNITVFVNGKILLDEMVSFFKDSYNVRPTSLRSKKYLYFHIDTFYHENIIFRQDYSRKKSTGWCLVSKSRRNDKFECIRVIMKWLNANVESHIFIRLITKDEMKRLTRSEDCSEIKGDSLYLAWTMMNWTLVGEVREYNIEKTDLCSNTDNSVSVFFPSNTI